VGSLSEVHHPLLKLLFQFLLFDSGKDLFTDRVNWLDSCTAMVNNLNDMITG
jgi:hypothetical protein